jgi:hypothetical protein
MPRLRPASINAPEGRVPIGRSGALRASADEPPSIASLNPRRIPPSFPAVRSVAGHSRSVGVQTSRAGLPCRPTVQTSSDTSRAPQGGRVGCHRRPRRWAGGHRAKVARPIASAHAYENAPPLRGPLECAVRAGQREQRRQASDVGNSSRCPCTSATGGDSIGRAKMLRSLRLAQRPSL